MGKNTHAVQQNQAIFPLTVIGAFMAYTAANRNPLHDRPRFGTQQCP
jgi:hypothetical protein